MPKKNKFSGPTSPKDGSQMQFVSKKYIIKDKNDPVWAFKLNQSLKLTSSKKAEKRKKHRSKRSNSKTKTSSGARSLSKYG